MRWSVAAVGLALALAAPPSADAWGFEAHKFIVDRAIALLPPELRPLFEANRAIVIERSIDPDTWRTAGFDDVESPRHFLNIDWEGYGPYPYAGLPRDYQDAVAKFGQERVVRNGTLPWRVGEMHRRLADAVAAYARRGSFGRFDVLFFSAWLAHYVSDAHVPFHAAVNHDGQLTGQDGIHVRFESTMFERYHGRLSIVTRPRAAERDPVNAAFEALVSGARLVPDILAADRQAIGTRRTYDDAYYDAFFDANRALLERRLGDSIASVAAMIAGAWEIAGRPPVPVRRADVSERRRP
jgi:hypothetical protein